MPIKIDNNTTAHTRIKYDAVVPWIWNKETAASHRLE